MARDSAHPVVLVMLTFLPHRLLWYPRGLKKLTVKKKTNWRVISAVWIETYYTF